MLNDFDALAIDLIDAGRAFSGKHRLKTDYKLNRLARLTVDALGQRADQFKIEKNEWLSQLEYFLVSVVEREQKVFSILGLKIQLDSFIANDWRYDKQKTRLLVRSTIVSVLRHFTGSPVEWTSGLREILFFEMNVGLDALVFSLKQGGVGSDLRPFFVNYTADCHQHIQHLRNPS